MKRSRVEGESVLTCVSNRRAGAAAAALAIVALLPSGAAHAQDLCSGLKQAVQQAATGFAGLKTATPHPDYPGATGIYVARSVFPGARDCYFEAASSLNYVCTLALNIEHQPNIAAYLAEVETAERCLAPVPAKRRGDPNKPGANGANTYWQIPPDVTLSLQLALDREGRARNTRRSIVVQKRAPAG